ncbi:hypothetical protein ACROYT_G036637 [Oculina patagonica]
MEIIKVIVVILAVFLHRGNGRAITSANNDNIIRLLGIVDEELNTALNETNEKPTEPGENQGDVFRLAEPDLPSQEALQSFGDDVSGESAVNATPVWRHKRSPVELDDEPECYTGKRKLVIAVILAVFLHRGNGRAITSASNDNIESLLGLVDEELNTTLNETNEKPTEREENPADVLRLAEPDLPSQEALQSFGDDVSGESAANATPVWRHKRSPVELDDEPECYTGKRKLVKLASGGSMSYPIWATFVSTIKEMPPKPIPEPSEGASASPTTTSGPNLQFISSEIARVPKLDIATSTPDGFQIWKQRWNSAVTITAFSDLPRETQQALFTNVLSDDTVKRMNILGLQDVNAIIESFQTQVIAVILAVFLHRGNGRAITSASNDNIESLLGLVDEELNTALNETNEKPTERGENPADVLRLAEPDLPSQEALQSFGDDASGESAANATPVWRHKRSPVVLDDEPECYTGKRKLVKLASGGSMSYPICRQVIAVILAVFLHRGNGRAITSAGNDNIERLDGIVDEELNMALNERNEKPTEQEGNPVEVLRLAEPDLPGQEALQSFGDDVSGESDNKGSVYAIPPPEATITSRHRRSLGPCYTGKRQMVTLASGGSTSYPICRQRPPPYSSACSGSINPNNNNMRECEGSNYKFFTIIVNNKKVTKLLPQSCSCAT